MDDEEFDDKDLPLDPEEEGEEEFEPEADF